MTKQPPGFSAELTGLQNEGWFDPWLFLAALKTKAASLGVQFVKGEVVGFKGDVLRTTVGNMTRMNILQVGTWIYVFYLYVF